MPEVRRTPLTVAVSARALFHLEKSHRVFRRKGLEAYIDHVRRNDGEELTPGTAFPLVRALLRLNDAADPDSPLVEVITASSMHPEAGMRVIAALDRHGMALRRASFTGGGPVLPYLKAFGTDLLLTKSKGDAQEAVDMGIAAALMYEAPGAGNGDDPCDGPIRIAFDGDAVIFSDDSERIYKKDGIEAFMEHETSNAQVPLPEGPFAKLLSTIHEIQKLSSASGRPKPFRIALFTARGGQARERVLRTFRAWGVEIDEAHFLSGYTKAGLVAAFRPHMFFDDQDVHLGPASKLVPSGLVPWRSRKETEEEGQAAGEAA